MATTIPASIARSQFGFLLEAASKRRQRFVISRGGRPAAVLLSIADFDDILEELDIEFQKSLRASAKEIRAGKGIPLQQYLKNRKTKRRAA